HRGAICHAGRQRVARQPGVGGAGVQRSGSTAQPHQSILDAAAAGRTGYQSKGCCRLYVYTTAGSYPAGAGNALGVLYDLGVPAANDALPLSDIFKNRINRNLIKAARDIRWQSDELLRKDK